MMNRKQRRRFIATGDKHEAFRQEILAVLRRHTDENHLPSEEVLAITASMVGMCLAMQNQATMTKERAMEIVKANIEIGNNTVIDDFARRPAAGSS